MADPLVASGCHNSAQIQEGCHNIHTLGIMQHQQAATQQRTKHLLSLSCARPLTEGKGLQHLVDRVLNTDHVLKGTYNS